MRIATTNKRENNKCFWECGEIRTFRTVSENVKWYIWKVVWHFLKKLKRNTQQFHLWVYTKTFESKDSKMYLHTDVCRAWFTIAKRWKQPMCLYLQMNGETKCDIYTKYCSALKVNEILIYAVTDGHWRHYPNTWYKPNTKGQTLYNTTYRRYLVESNS